MVHYFGQEAPWCTNMLDATSGQTHHVTLHGGTLRGGTFLGGPLLHGVLDGLLCAGKLRVKHYYMMEHYLVEHYVWNTTTWCYVVFHHVHYVVGRHLLRANAGNVASEENIPASYAPHSAEYKRLPSSKSKSSSCCFTNLQHKSSLGLDSTRFYTFSFLA